MCRLFGFRSIINSQVHSSLVHTENALSSQSVKHPDGWGVSYYREGIPHLIKSTDRAIDDQIFHKVSGVVSSQTVLAHIRKATQGKLNLLNSHPFQYGKWVFAHNGNLKNFENYKDQLKKLVAPDLRRFILGTTDSEIIFFLLLTILKDRIPLGHNKIEFDVLSDVVERLCTEIINFSGPLYGGNEVAPSENHITFLLTNGETMFGFNGGQNLHYSTHKQICDERSTCPFFSKVCENPVVSNKKINHLLISSEILEGQNVWNKIPKGTLIGVDNNMIFKQRALKVTFS